MVYRVLAGLIFPIMGYMVLIWSGALGGSSFSMDLFGSARLIERPPAEVYAALDNIAMQSAPALEIVEDVPPVQKAVVPGQSISWTFYSGEHPALTMTATVEPKRDGAAAIVDTDITRHRLPDGQITTGAFRVPGGMEFVLKMLIADALAPMSSDYAQELQVARNSATLVVHDQLRAARERHEYATRKNRDNDDPRMGSLRKMVEDGQRQARQRAEQRAAGVNFRPGEPMIDPTVR